MYCSVLSCFWCYFWDTTAVWLHRDIGTDIGQLLRSLTTVLPSGGLKTESGAGPESDLQQGPQDQRGEERGVMLRLGMTNPPYMLEHLQAVAEVLRHPQVYSFLHVPCRPAATAYSRQ